MAPITEEYLDQRLDNIKEKEIDRAFAAEHDLWNALLAMNGVTLAILSVVITLKGEQLPVVMPWLAGFGIAISLICVVALLGCFRNDRDHYIQQLADGKNPPESDKEMDAVMTAGMIIVLESRRMKRVLESVAFVSQSINVILIIIALVA